MVEKLDELEQMLLSLRGEIMKEINKAIKTGADSSSSDPSGDIYDQASSERDRELGLILSDRERQKLHQVDEALLRLKEGEYGICEECEEEIPLGRLKAMPFARHCVKCKADLEKLQAHSKRLEEERAYRDINFVDEEEV